MAKKHEGKRTLGSLRHRREENIKMHLKEIRWPGLDLSG
jgi:hypothetical protein